MYGVTVGKTGLLAINATTNQAICAIIPKKNEISPVFLKYYVIFSRNHLIALSSGAAQPNISQGIIRAFKILKPTIDEQEKSRQFFKALTALLIKQIWSLRNIRR